MEALFKSARLAAPGRMTASIAHEINNPLEAVENSIYLAKIVPELPGTAGNAWIWPTPSRAEPS